MQSIITLERLYMFLYVVYNKIEVDREWWGRKYFQWADGIVWRYCIFHKTARTTKRISDMLRALLGEFEPGNPQTRESENHDTAKFGDNIKSTVA